MERLRRIITMLLAAVTVFAVCGSVSAAPTLVYGAQASEAPMLLNSGVDEEEGDIDVPFPSAPTLRSIYIETLPTKLRYMQGQALDMSGAVVKAYYSNGTNKTVTGYTVSGYSADTLGKQRVTVSYGDRSTIFTVTVVAYGDVDGSGAVDGVDTSLLLQYVAGWDVDVDRAAADVDANGAVDGVDTSLLLQYVAGWDVTLGRK